MSERQCTAHRLSKKYNDNREMITMATSTYNPSLASSSDDSQAKPGFFSKIFNGFVEMQTARARILTAQFMSSLTDEQLADYGWSPQDIKRLRKF